MRFLLAILVSLHLSSTTFLAIMFMRAANSGGREMGLGDIAMIALLYVVPMVWLTMQALKGIALQEMAKRKAKEDETRSPAPRVNTHGGPWG